MIPLPRTPFKIAGLAAGLLAFALLAGLDSPLHRAGANGARPAYAAGVAALMAIWWLTEALPIHVTACVPLALFPALGVFGGDVLDGVGRTARPYVDSYIFLFMGGMCIAAAMQQWDLHRRIAIAIMWAIGTDARRLLFGVLAATAFISLWISNTATAAMMLPIGMAIVAECESAAGGRRLERYGCAIMLAVAYAANVGGIGTKIGTAPNAQLCGFLARHGVEVSFLEFAAVGLPFVAIFIPIVWLALWRLGRADAPAADAGAAILEREAARLGRLKREEAIVLGVFAATAAAWISAGPIAEAIAPRVAAFKLVTADVEGGAAMLAAVVLLLWRSRGRQVLELATLRTVPWETLLLLGGSFSMAAGIKESGLSALMGESLAGVRGLAPFVQTLAASVATVALSAVASNTATTAVMLGVLKDSVSPDHATTVLFTAALASSCDFALPAGTPPNAIVFGSGYVTIPRMAKTGAVLDLAAAVIVAAWCFLIVRVAVS